MIGIPLFYSQELRGIMMQFRDNFADRSLYWAWNTDEADDIRHVVSETDVPGKLSIIAEGGGTEGYNSRWRGGDNFAPKVVIGGGAYPLEIITKMENYALGVDTQAGLYIAGNPGGVGSNMWITRCRKASGFNGLVVMYEETVQRFAQDEIQDVPIFFRIRVGNWTYDRKKVIFGYSLNGVNWVDVYEEVSTPWDDTWGMGIGLFVSNDTEYLTNYNGVSAQFDYFKMRTRSININ